MVSKLQTENKLLKNRIEELENELKTLCEEYGLEYDNNDEEDESESEEESEYESETDEE